MHPVLRHGVGGDWTREFESFPELADSGEKWPIAFSERFCSIVEILRPDLLRIVPCARQGTDVPCQKL